MRLFRVVYDTVWFRCHPITGPITGGDPLPVMYPTWAMAWHLANMYD